MKIDFSKIEEAVMPNFYGGEKEYNPRIYNDGVNKIMYGRLIPGASIGLHTHETNSEIMYFLKGTATMIYDGVPEKIEPGVCHYCEKGHSHTLINDGGEDLEFFAVVPEQ